MHENYDYYEKQNRNNFNTIKGHQYNKNMNYNQNNNPQNYNNNEYSYNSNQRRYEDNIYQNNFSENNNKENIDFITDLNNFNKYEKYLETTSYMKKFLIIIITIFHFLKESFLSNYKLFIFTFLNIEIIIYFLYILFSSKRKKIIKRNKTDFYKYKKNRKKINREVDYYIDNHG